MPAHGTTTLRTTYPFRFGPIQEVAVVQATSDRTAGDDTGGDGTDLGERCAGIRDRYADV